MLHPQKNVVIQQRYTLNQVTTDMPQVDNPQKVSDIVVLTSFNDIRQPNTTVPEILKKLDETCQSVSAAYPNSAIHVGGVPPINEKMIDYNNELRTLVNDRQANFIPMESMLDENTGMIQSDIMKKHDRLHFTGKGLKTMAKEVKRSLYGYYRQKRSGPRHGSDMKRPSSTNNRSPTNSRPTMANNGIKRPYSTNQSTNNQSMKDPRQTMANFLNMAMSCLNSI